MGYTKLSHTILSSTVWMEDADTRLVWITLLASTNRHGEVQASIPGLAHIARVPVEACRAAIAKFLAPDPDSRSPEFEGRRIEVIPGGWSLLRHAYYRDLESDNDRKAKSAERQARYRLRQKQSGVASALLVAPASHRISHTDPDPDPEKIKSIAPKPRKAKTPASLPDLTPSPAPAPADTTGPDAKRLLDFFVANWRKHYPGQTYVVNGAKDMACLKRLLSQVTPDDLAERVRVFFRSKDKFVIGAKHSLPVFVATINAQAPGAPGRPLGASPQHEDLDPLVESLCTRCEPPVSNYDQLRWLRGARLDGHTLHVEPDSEEWVRHAMLARFSEAHGFLLTLVSHRA